MSEFVIQGGKRIAGEYRVQGAKNSALPILAACAATNGVCVLHGCPDLTDVEAALHILEHLGCPCRREGDTVSVDARNLNGCDIPDNLMREMRSSIIFLGPLLCRAGCAQLSAPGGCEIGLRPIDLHLESMRQLGVEIDTEDGRLHCEAPKGLQGARISLSFPSVGATENVMIAASTAKGMTVLTHAAREPEIVDLANFLNACGAKIHGAGDSTLVIDGVEKLHSTEHAVIPDRIAAATILSAAAITGGEIVLQGARADHLDSILSSLEQGGCRIQRLAGNALNLKVDSRLRRFPTLRTMPYPGFPTDAQAILMALASVADGTSIIIETIFENRFRHVSELCRMGANIRAEGSVAVVEGVKQLHGAIVGACDLRAGTALILAGLAAEGETRVRDTHHVDRGCERIENTLTELGADIRKIESDI